MESNLSDFKAIQSLATEVIRGNYTEVKRLANAELVKARSRLHDGRTVLILAADANTRVECRAPWQYVKCMELLLHLGADPSAADIHGDTAAHIAARQDNLHLMSLLPFESKFQQNQDKRTPLMEAVLAESWSCTKHLLHLFRQFRHYNKKNELVINTRDKDGLNVLDLARARGNHCDLAVVIRSELQMVVARFAEGGTRDHNHEMHYKITPQLSDEEMQQYTSMVDSIKLDDVEMLQKTATRLNVDLPGPYGVTALTWASRLSQNEQVLEFLILIGDPTVASLDGGSCLHWASIDNSSDAIIGHLVKAGAYVNYQDELGRSPLMRAVCNPYGGIAVELLDYGANWEIKDIRGLTAAEIDLTESGTGSVTESMLIGGAEKRFFASPIVGPLPFRKTWENLRLLGRGGFGDVHEVLTDRNVKCAVKTIRLPFQLGTSQQVGYDQSVEKVIDAEENVFSLRHENIVKFWHTVIIDNYDFVIVMELLDGQSLAELIEAEKSKLTGTPTGSILHEDRIRHFSKQICSGLHYLHSRKPPVIHRDINGRNIMVVGGSEQIKLIDFGLSIKLHGSISRFSATSQAPSGTLNFMAPELLGAGESEGIRYSRESDIWAFGCTLYHMVTGSVPHSACLNILSLALTLHGGGAPDMPADCSAELKEFYTHCVGRERSARMSAGQLLNHGFLTASQPSNGVDDGSVSRAQQQVRIPQSGLEIQPNLLPETLPAGPYSSGTPSTTGTLPPAPYGDRYVFKLATYFPEVKPFSNCVKIYPSQFTQVFKH